MGGLSTGWLICCFNDLKARGWTSIDWTDYMSYDSFKLVRMGGS